MGQRGGLESSWPVIGQGHERTCSHGCVSFHRVERDMEDGGLPLGHILGRGRVVVPSLRQPVKD